MNVFLIDDDEANLLIIEQALKKEMKYNLSIHKYNTVERAISNNYIQPEVIILDNFLDLTNGILALPILKKYIPNASISILSSKKDDMLLSEALREGAKDYIKKDKDMLPKIIEFIENEIVLRKDITSEETKSNSSIRTALKKVFKNKRI